MQATDQTPRSLKVERCLILASFFILSFIIIINMSLGAVILIMGTKDFWYTLVPIFIFTTYMQQSINVLYHTNSLRRMLKNLNQSSSQLDEEQRTALENKILWAISLNPIFPCFARFKRCSIVIIELVHLGSMIFSIFIYTFIQGESKMRAPGNPVNNGITVQLTFFFTISWMLIGSPVVALFLRVILTILLGIPLLIYVCKEKQTPKDEDL